jgi:hypothetical protein
MLREPWDGGQRWVGRTGAAGGLGEHVEPSSLTPKEAKDRWLRARAVPRVPGAPG